MSELRRVTNPDQPVLGKIQEPTTSEDLLPVIVVEAAALAADGLAAIRMQGYATYEAVEKTFATGAVTFWSRSQQGLWTKGETSGNILRLIAAYTDCDADSLLIDAQPVGPTCHTGARSCFEIPDIGE